MSKENKTHWKKYFNSDYLGCQDLEHNKDLIAVIARVEEKELNVPGTGKTEAKGVLFFEGGVKPMVLNVTNSRTVAAIAGSNYVEDWQGLPISIYIDPNVRFGRDTVEGLRIRMKIASKPKKPTVKPGSKEWANSVKGLLMGRKWADIEKAYTVSKEAKKAIDEEVAAAREKEANQAKTAVA